MIAKKQILSWLEEDIQTGDITCDALISSTANSTAELILKESGILCGLEFVETIVKTLDPSAKIIFHVKDGEFTEKGTLLVSITGNYIALLKAERTCLNLLQHLSGVATATHQYVKETAPYRAKIFDTRKTTPGYRALEKLAVKTGGGCNHRMGLYDQFLIKENHLKNFLTEDNPFSTAINTARAYKKGTPIIIEVENLHEFRQALIAEPSVILLDNMSLTDMAQAVLECDDSNKSTQLEASGGITLNSINKISATGVHRISVGAITHSAPNLDISMLIQS